MKMVWVVFCIGAAVDIADGLKPIKWDLQDDKMRQEVVCGWKK